MVGILIASLAFSDITYDFSWAYFGGIVIEYLIKSLPVKAESLFLNGHPPAIVFHFHIFWIIIGMLIGHFIGIAIKKGFKKHILLASSIIIFLVIVTIAVSETIERQKDKQHDFQKECTELREAIEDMYEGYNRCQPEDECSEVFVLNSCEIVAVRTEGAPHIEEAHVRYLDELKCDKRLELQCEYTPHGVKCIEGRCKKI
ncbi:hypothetical protein HYS48_00615 [Candidatus Woesearchaeota archaeon]|nr:hypothetical protein [Candidatus Woesearchaeota archaeon]